MKRESIEMAAKEFGENHRLLFEADVVDFAIQRVNAALEEAASITVGNCLELPKGKPCVFCCEQADAIRALKIP